MAIVRFEPFRDLLSVSLPKREDAKPKQIQISVAK